MEEIIIDHALMTGRPEANTFHFPYGEATVTLEDVAYIYELLLDGKNIPGVYGGGGLSWSGWKGPWLGPDVNEINIKFTGLEDNFRPSTTKNVPKIPMATVTELIEDDFLLRSFHNIYWYL